MFDYLNEYLFLFRGVKGRSGTVRKAQQLKRRGDYYIFNKLCSDYCSRIKWKYKPKYGKNTIATELIEKTILFDGACGIIKYKENFETPNGIFTDESWRNVRSSGINNQSFYGYTSTFTGTSYNGKQIGTFIPVQQQETSGIANSILIYDNLRGWSPLSIIFYYAERLSIINTSINACLQNITGTTLITCTPEQTEMILKQREAAGMGVPIVLEYIDNTTAGPEPKLMATPGPNEQLKTLYEAYDKTYHDFLQAIGIRVNNEMDRHSGITPMEIVENRMNVDIVLNDALNTRKQAIELGKRIGLEGLEPTVDNFENKTGDYTADGEKIGITATEETTTTEEGEEEENV